jgi:hypothetical protein
MAGSAEKGSILWPGVHLQDQTKALKNDFAAAISPTNALRVE